MSDKFKELEGRGKLERRIDMVRSRKGEWLLVLEDDGPLFLICRQDGVQIHLEGKQLDLESRSDLDLNSNKISDKQRRAFAEFQGSDFSPDLLRKVA